MLLSVKVIHTHLKTIHTSSHDNTRTFSQYNTHPHHINTPITPPVHPDITANMMACEELTEKHHCDLILLGAAHTHTHISLTHTLSHTITYSNIFTILLQLHHYHFPVILPINTPCQHETESGGDNLAADFSRELADFTVYVSDPHTHPLLYTHTHTLIHAFSYTPSHMHIFSHTPFPSSLFPTSQVCDRCRGWG